MVVNDVQYGGEPMSMDRVHQSLQTCGAAIRILRSILIHSVVTPVPGAGKLSHGHDFNRRNAEVDQSRERRDHRLKRAFPRVSSDVQFIKHAAFESAPSPVGITPLKCASI